MPRMKHSRLIHCDYQDSPIVLTTSQVSLRLTSNWIDFGAEKAPPFVAKGDRWYVA